MSKSQQNEMKPLTDEYKRVHLPHDLEEKTATELRKLGQFKLQYAQHGSVIRILGVTATALALFCLGFFVGRMPGIPQGVPGNDNGEKYLLLLHNPPGYVESDDHVKEYSEWLKKNNGIVEQGDELKTMGWTIAVRDGKPLVRDLASVSQTSGFFIIDVNSQNEALALAMTCPHITHNGVIELRAIQKH